MRCVPLALSTTFSSLHFMKPPSSSSSLPRPRVSTQTREPSLISNLSESAADDFFFSRDGCGFSALVVCRASQVVDFFPTVSPEIVVREAKLEDCWGVAETHCSSFFVGYRFPLDLMLRINRLVTLIFGFSVPSGCKRTCLVAVTGNSAVQAFLLGNEYVAGILTLDTVADFLPPKGPQRQRRTGIAYASNVAVREKFRRKGIAKRLVQKAEAQARSWGCRSIALHCDLNNPEATKLYLGQGFKCIKVPQGANWPQPKTSTDIKFNFMMKLLK